MSFPSHLVALASREDAGSRRIFSTSRNILPKRDLSFVASRLPRNSPHPTEIQRLKQAIKSDPNPVGSSLPHKGETFAVTAQ